MAGLDVFAVEDRAVQLAWASLPGPELVLEVADQQAVIGAEAPAWYRQARNRPVAGRTGPGAVRIGGLQPDTTYDVCLSGPQLPRRRVAEARTLPPPPGQLLARFATISDCHIGEQRVGFFHRLHDPSPRPPGLDRYPERCAWAALAAAEAWGAERIVVKGDITDYATAEELYRAAELLGRVSVPIELVLGNHDVKGPFDAAAVLESVGQPVPRQPRALDLPGARLIFGHSPLPDRHAGAVDSSDIEAMAGLAGEATGGVVVALHHPPQRFALETKYPPSIGGRDSNQLVSALAAANRSTCILGGHTHRNRRYQIGGLTVAEVGSTKDYPGVWAGYSVYEGGIRQVVLRVADPLAIAWTETTKRALGGVWGWWSPGQLGDRCWTLEWPNRVSPAVRMAA